MTSLKVLHVTECLGGGAPVAIADYVRATPDCDHHVLWRVANNGIAKDLDATIHLMPENPAAQWRKVRKALAQVGPDVVLAHSSLAGFYTRVPSPPMPLAYQPHGFAFESDNLPWLLRHTYTTAEKLMAKRADIVVGLTSREMALAEELGARSISRVPNRSRAASGAPPRDARALSIVTAGRVAPQKDPYFFAAMSRAVRRHLPNAKFTWVGSGDQRLEAMLAEAGVEVTGWMPQESVWDLMAESSVYVHTATYEGFPLTVLDAAKLGLPVAVRDIPAFDEVLLRKASTPESLAAIVVRILTDPSERAEVCNYSVLLNESTSEDAQRRALSAVFEELGKRVQSHA